MGVPNNFVNAVGEKHGRLTVLHRIGNKGTVYSCKCSCGVVRDYRIGNLRSGATKSCGCLREENRNAANSARLDDKTGKQYGEWTVLTRGPNRAGKPTWSCRCSCGIARNVAAAVLQNGDSTSCGCRTFARRTVVINKKRFSVQGHEAHAIRYLIQDKKLKASQINIGRDQVPVVDYSYGRKKRKHYPDIFVPHLNQLIEVKSLWTLGLDRDVSMRTCFAVLKAKRRAAIAAGFKYTVLVFNQNGRRIVLPRSWYSLTRTQLQMVML